MNIIVTILVSITTSLIVNDLWLRKLDKTLDRLDKEYIDRMTNITVEMINEHIQK